LAGDAYIAGLTLLARRELSEAQLRTRLTRRKFSDDDIDDAIARLKTDRALDDRRVARACARTETGIKHRGRLRVVRQIESLGIDREIAREAVAEVFGDIDEPALLERALDRKLRHGDDLTDRKIVERIQRYLLAQGFEGSRIRAIIDDRRSKSREPRAKSRL
jgi:regulatory protein